MTINPAYRTHELAFVLRHAGVSTLVAAPAFKTSDYAGMIEQVRPDCPDLDAVVLLGRPGMEELLDTGRSADPAELAAIAPTLSADDPINIEFTSGTTGFPKARPSRTTTS